VSSSPSAASTALDRTRARTWLWVSVASFVVSRLVYALHYGVRFEDSSLLNYMQFIDPLLLRTDLARSIYYLRDQPPLFNLFLGVVLKTSGAHATAVFQGVYLALGLSLVCSMYLLLVRLRVGPAFAAIVTLSFAVAPTTILYENWLFYTYPVAALLSASALFLHRFLVDRRLSDATAFFSLLAVIVLTRGIFHFAWLLLLLGALLIFCWTDRRHILLGAAGPAIVVAAFYLKTLLVFGTFLSGHSYQQMNFAVMTVSKLPEGRRQALIKQGLLSPVTTIEANGGTSFRKFAKYIPKYTATGIPLLDKRKKSTGYTNWQHGMVVDIATLFEKDARVVDRLHPELYWRSVSNNVRGYTMVSSHTFPFASNASPNAWKLGHLVRAHDRYLAGVKEAYQPSPGLAVGFLAAIAFGLAVCVRWLWRRCPRSDAAHVLTVGYALFNIVYVSAVTILFSYGDHNRYRFKVTPFYCLLLALLAHAAWRYATHSQRSALRANSERQDDTLLRRP